MPDLRAPRLVKKKPTSQLKPQHAKPKPKKRSHLISEIRLLGSLTYYQHRLRKLQLFEAHLRHSPEKWERRLEVLPHYRAMIAARVIRSRPLPAERRKWLFDVSASLAARELFRLEYNQHCPSVTWSPDDVA